MLATQGTRTCERAILNVNIRPSAASFVRSLACLSRSRPVCQPASRMALPALNSRLKYCILLTRGVCNTVRTCTLRVVTRKKAKVHEFLLLILNLSLLTGNATSCITSCARSFSCVRAARRRDATNWRQRRQHCSCLPASGVARRLTSAPLQQKQGPCQDFGSGATLGQ